jgi:hypothetical protein
MASGCQLLYARLLLLLPLLWLTVVVVLLVLGYC